MEEIKVLYRCEVRNYSEEYTPVIEYKEYKIISETKCGYWVHEYGKYGHKKFVLKTDNHSGKRFSYVTKKEALNSLLFRRLRMQRILRTQQARNNETLVFIEELIKGDDYTDSSYRSTSNDNVSLY